MTDLLVLALVFVAGAMTGFVFFEARRISALRREAHEDHIRRIHQGLYGHPELSRSTLDKVVEFKAEWPDTPY
jgi:hypothetical protein